MESTNAGATGALIAQRRRELPVVHTALCEDSQGQVQAVSGLSPELQDAIRQWRCWSYYQLRQKELR